MHDLVSDLKLPYSVSGVGSIFKIFFGDLPHNYQDALRCDNEGYLRFFHRVLGSGISLPSSQFGTDFLSIAHTAQDIGETINVYAKNLRVK